MKGQYIYILFLLIVGLGSCEKFQTEIDVNRESFFKIYPKDNNNYNGIHGNYIVNTNEGFLLGGNLFPQSTTNQSRQIRVSYDGELIEKKDLTNSLSTYTKIIPSDDGENFYFLGTHSGDNHSDLIRMSLTDYEPIKESSFEASVKPTDFSLFSNNGQENIIALVRDNNEFDNIKLILMLLDENLKSIWKRELSFEETALIGFSVIHEASSGHFIVLGRDSDYQLFIMKVNEDGNLIDVRFFKEFGFDPINEPQQTSVTKDNATYKPTLLDMGTHYMVIETGRLFTKSDTNLPFSSIYRVDKGLTDIQLVSTNTNFSSVSTVQNIENEIIINGFISDSIFAIKLLDNEGNLKTWANSENEDYVSFDMNLKTLGEGIFFNNSPSLGDYEDFFTSGNVVRTHDGGFAMIGTYGIFNGDEFETVMTLFKFRSDGSY